MKNNQFRAYLDKHIKRKYNNLKCLTVDIDSNKRNVYLYTELSEDCIGTICLYFANEYVNIAYSNTTQKVCKITNTREEKQFDYCNLKYAKKFIDQALTWFVNNYKEIK